MTVTFTQLLSITVLFNNFTLKEAVLVWHPSYYTISTNGLALILIYFLIPSLLNWCQLYYGCNQFQVIATIFLNHLKCLPCYFKNIICPNLIHFLMDPSLLSYRISDTLFWHICRWLKHNFIFPWKLTAPDFFTVILTIFWCILRSLINFYFLYRCRLMLIMSLLSTALLQLCIFPTCHWYMLALS